MSAQLRHLILNNGLRIPSIGFGTYLAVRNEVKEATDGALDVGYRHIDTAVSYGNEGEIGEALSRHLRLGNFSRKDVFVTTKVPSVYLAPEDVEPCVIGALDRLQLQYVDLLLIHHPWGIQNLRDGNLKPADANGKLLFANYDLNITWKAFESIKAKGHAKAIGLSNFNRGQIHQILNNCRTKPANVQLECHAYLQQSNLRNFCKEEDIVVTGYAPLGSPGRPVNKKSPEDPDLLSDVTVKNIAEQCQKTPAQIVIRYVMQMGVVPLPKSTNFERIKENFEAQYFDLSEEQMKLLAGLDRNYRYLRFPWARGHPEFSEGSDF